jgi:hypothetical protein
MLSQVNTGNTRPMHPRNTTRHRALQIGFKRQAEFADE